VSCNHPVDLVIGAPTSGIERDLHTAMHTTTTSTVGESLHYWLQWTKTEMLADSMVDRWRVNGIDIVKLVGLVLRNTEVAKQLEGTYHIYHTFLTNIQTTQ
jgi:hypothetical protein